VILWRFSLEPRVPGDCSEPSNSIGSDKGYAQIGKKVVLVVYVTSSLPDSPQETGGSRKIVESRARDLDIVRCCAHGVYRGSVTGVW